jgi:hypothetical protein
MSKNKKTSNWDFATMEKLLSEPAQQAIRGVREDDCGFIITPEIAEEICESYFGKYWAYTVSAATGLPIDTDWDALRAMAPMIPRKAEGWEEREVVAQVDAWMKEVGLVK